MSHSSEKMAFGKCRLLTVVIKNFIIVSMVIISNQTLHAQAPNLGATSNFALFTAAGAFNNVGASTVVTGDVGTNVGAFNAFPPGTLIGSRHIADVVSAQAAADVLTAYTYLDGLTCGMVLGTTMGSGQVLTPNIYCLGAASTINGNLTLDAQGDPNAIFIFQIDGALATTTLSNVSLINSASLCNVFWQINGEAALGNNSVFVGTMLVQGAIRLLQGATLNGRGLSTAGAISLAENIVNIPGSLPPAASTIAADGPTTFCVGDSVTLTGNVGGIWKNGSTASSIVVKDGGDYYVINANGCGSDTSNHIFVSLQGLPVLSAQLIGVCGNDNIFDILSIQSGITVQSGIFSYSLNGSPIPNPAAFVASDNDVVLVTFTDNISGCVNTTTISFSVFDAPTVNIGPFPTQMCPDMDIQLTGIASGGSGVILTHNWTGTGSAYLIDPNVQNPIFNNNTVGTYDLVYTVTDENGCTGSKSIIIEVTNGVELNIICPENMIIDLNPLECGRAVVYNIFANCNTADIYQIAGLNSGSVFPIGINTITFVAEDAAGNTDTCTFTITVRDFQNPPIGCINVNLSLNGDCNGTLTATTVLTGYQTPEGNILLGCLDCFKINVSSPTGIALGSTVDKNYLNKTLIYTILNTKNGFTCFGNVTIEDKIAPTITCRDVSVNCLTDLSTVFIPVASDNCGAKSVLVNEVHETLLCDEDYIGTVTRTWIAVDDAGNSSLPCTQIIYLERSVLNGIVFPDNDTLTCNSGFRVDDRGNSYPAPSETGVPTYKGNDLYPMSQLNMLYCNSTIDYTDVLILDTKCKKIILRTWMITEWWCSTAVQKLVSIQRIDIVDNIAPVIPIQSDITVTTETRSCSANVLLPRLNITDNCTAIYRVYVNTFLNGLPSGYVNGNGGSIELPSGIHTITYSALDDCGNQRDMSYRITVQDDTDPVAICDQFATISIKTNGYTEVTAQAIDNGSFDECGLVTLKIRRMEDPCDFGADEGWFDKVGFCCLDANTTRMVQLLVTDAGGNTNICMVSVNVQEKVDPRITCLGDITINDCLYTFDPQNPAAYFGTIVIADNCPANNQLREVVTDNRNQCGIGTVVRTTSVIGGGTTYQTCVQTITFRNEEPFYINDADHADTNDDIIWPADYTALGQCSALGLEPAITGEPVFTEDACDLVGMRYEDAVYPFTTNGACFKIIRTWTVIDWCQIDDAGNHLTWSHDQEIKVMDNVIPTITSSSAPKLVLTYDGLCQDGQIVLTASATDCTPANELRWSWVVTKGGIVFRTGTGNNASGTYPIGIYEIAFTVEDKCGNLAKTGYDFEIRNAKAPTAICKKGLSASLGLMDSDGNGIGDTIMVILKPAFFNNKSSHVCGYALKLSFSSNVYDTIVSFSCADLGSQTIEMWVTDVNGNTSYCETFVDIQDSQGLCPSMLFANVSGKTFTENNAEIEDVIVEMKGSELAPINTDINGHYAFTPMPIGGEYQVMPGKDGDDKNGVSTLDIVMIQRHILGIEKLKGPYQILAADINNNKTVSASDLTELHKLVLGLIPSFNNNTSWRFVDASYQFVDKQDPWMTSIAEWVTIEELRSQMDINFIGIKVGDVNGSAKGKNILNNLLENRSKVNVVMDDRNVMKGDIVEIPVLVPSHQTIYGMQMAWKSNGLLIREIKDGAFDIGNENYSVTDINHSALSVSIPDGLTVNGNDILFVLEVEALKTGKLSDMLQLSDAVRPEIYVADMATSSVGISFKSKSDTDFKVITIAPNPWNTNTDISFELPKDGMVSFKVKDYMGRKVISTIDQYKAGKNTINLNKSDIGQAGVYVYELRYDNKVVSGKMILID